MNKSNKLQIFLISLILISSINSMQSLKKVPYYLNDMFGVITEQNSLVYVKEKLTATQGTEAFFFSPHALGKQVEVAEALKVITPLIKIARTTYNHSENTYIMDNFMIDLQYNDARQNISITDTGKIQIINGTVFFGYRFNFQIKNSTKNISGTGFGSIYSDALEYKKQLGLSNAGDIQWQLSKEGVSILTMSNSRMKIKRIEPFDSNSLSVLEQMMDRAYNNISPSNIENQFLDAFNREFPKALNKSINHEVFNKKIEYSFNHYLKGPLNLTLLRQMWDFGVDKTEGYKMVYVTEIEGHEKQTTCNTTIPYNHQDFSIYGGIQTIHLNCLYQDVVNYMQAQGWLDTVLNSNWEVNAFQFYAGDLFDIMSSLYTKVNPKSILQGQCKADNKNLVFKTSPQITTNTYLLKVDYNCTLKTTSKTADTLDILKFTAQTNFYIKVFADKTSLNFQISQADVVSMTFVPVNNFIVTNLNLAFFKADQVIKKNLKYKTFGTGFPTIPMQTPRTRIDRQKVLYYDSSAFNSTFPNFNQKSI